MSDRTLFPRNATIAEAVAAINRGTTVEDIRNTAARVREDSSRTSDAVKRQLSAKAPASERTVSEPVSGRLIR